VIPNILGAHEGDILYWAGKSLAREFPAFDIEELPKFFSEAGWGTLSLDKTTKIEAFYTLTGDSQYIKADSRTFNLEAGFIAEQYQKVNGLLTECFSQVQRKGDVIQFQVKWDIKTKV